MKLYNCLKPELIKLDCTASNTEDFLREMLHSLKMRDKISDETFILQKLLEREKLGSTSIGNFAAVPHTKLKDIKEPIIAVGTSKHGFLYNETDKENVHLVILILSPNYSPIIHLQILAAAASLVKKSGPLIKDILAAKDAEELMNIIRKYESEDD